MGVSGPMGVDGVVLVRSHDPLRRPWMWFGRWARPEWAVIEHGEEIDITMFGDAGFRYMNGRRPTFLALPNSRWVADGDFGRLWRPSGRDVWWFSNLRVAR